MIDSNSSILDVVSDFPVSEDFFRQYDSLAEKCVLCSNLFDPLDDFCKLYGINLDQFLESLNHYIEKNSR